MDILELDRRASDALGKVVATVTPEDLRRPTPCADWTLYGLIRHQVSDNLGFAAAASGTAPGRSGWDGGVLGADPSEDFQRSVALVNEAFAAEGMLERRVEVREFGVLPGAFAVSMHFVDGVVHGWDVARALGMPGDLTPDLAEAALEMVLRMPLSRGPGQAFGHPVEAAGGAPVYQRLVAHLGRDPRWTP
ncbi:MULTISPECIES: TIGR03086 family metal-binding protein [unclassified Streptosporangium]|uniref:TIGR03086 family metal-binding protein n=1 Tax=unclassified Streptosporangium TaxID=2632669 RepID=UPI002E2C370E|nr:MULTISPECIES: TIGR03086 family metal-binding protein [unclassified Streptosporangium]